MFKVVFKNMNASSLTSENIHQRLMPIIDKYPDIKNHRMSVTIEMENSPQQAGQDFFSISIMMTGKIFKDLRIKKSSENFYIALSSLVESLNAHLSRRHQKNSRSIRKNLELKEVIL